MNVPSLRELGEGLIQTVRGQNAKQLNMVRALLLKTERKVGENVANVSDVQLCSPTRLHVVHSNL